MPKIVIRNELNGRSTDYGPELVKDARHAVKGLGKLTGYHVEFFQPSGRAQLVAHYIKPDNTGLGYVTVAI